jgi:hypothetical protein
MPSTHAPTVPALLRSGRLIALPALPKRQRSRTAPRRHDRCETARQALEDRRAEFLLDVLDAAVVRRGRHVQALGGPGDRADAGHFIDIAQQTQVVHGARSRNDRAVLGAWATVAVSATQAAR